MAIIQGRDDGHLDKVAAGEVWEISEFLHILKVKKTGFSDEIEKDYERRVQNDFKAFGMSS